MAEGDPIDERQLWHLIDELESSGQLEDRKRLRRFMRCCCRSLSGLLPPEADRWLGVADGYYAGDIPASDLLAARLHAWEHLGNESCNFTLPRVNAVRAVLFLLFPDDDSGFSDASLLVSHFVDFCEGAGIPSAQQHACLAEAYGFPFGDRADA